MQTAGQDPQNHLAPCLKKAGGTGGWWTPSVPVSLWVVGQVRHSCVGTGEGRVSPLPIDRGEADSICSAFSICTSHCILHMYVCNMYICLFPFDGSVEGESKGDGWNGGIWDGRTPGQGRGRM